MAAILGVSTHEYYLLLVRTDFNRNQITGWAGLVRVDGTVKKFLGDPAGPEVVTQTGFEYTSTTSKFLMTVDDKIQMNVTFLSPVTPTDFKRQSLVFSYMEVSVESMDGAGHEVEIYSDISAGAYFSYCKGVS